MSSPLSPNLLLIMLLATAYPKSLFRQISINNIKMLTSKCGKIGWLTRLLRFFTRTGKKVFVSN
ncbi:hypothetical protein Hanom_Chr06g00571161 [Helianthus anomalus]